MLKVRMTVRRFVVTMLLGSNEADTPLHSAVRTFFVRGVLGRLDEPVGVENRNYSNIEILTVSRPTDTDDSFFEMAKEVFRALSFAGYASSLRGMAFDSRPDGLVLSRLILVRRDWGIPKNIWLTVNIEGESLSIICEKIIAPDYSPEKEVEFIKRSIVAMLERQDAAWVTKYFT